MNNHQIEGVIVTVKPGGVTDLAIKEGVKVFGHCTIFTVRLVEPNPPRKATPIVRLEAGDATA